MYILIPKGDNNYLPFQEINKRIKKLFQDRHQDNIWAVRNVQRYCISINLYLSADGSLFHVALEVLGYY